MALITLNKCCICFETCKLKCSRCKMAYYCSVAHQHQHWEKHKWSCSIYIELPTQDKTALKGTVYTSDFATMRICSYICNKVEDKGAILLYPHSNNYHLRYLSLQRAKEAGTGMSLSLKPENSFILGIANEDSNLVSEYALERQFSKDDTTIKTAIDALLTPDFYNGDIVLVGTLGKIELARLI